MVKPVYYICQVTIFRWPDKIEMELNRDVILHILLSSMHRRLSKKWGRVLKDDKRVKSKESRGSQITLWFLTRQNELLFQTLTSQMEQGSNETGLMKAKIVKYTPRNSWRFIPSFG
jgi:hypothetical protein